MSHLQWLIYIYIYSDWYHYNSCLDKVNPTHVFRSCHSLLVLRNTREHFSTIFGGHLKQWNHQQKHKKCENIFLNRSGKGHLFTVWDRKPASSTSAGSTYAGQFKRFAPLLMCTNDWLHCGYWHQGYKHTRLSEFRNTESLSRGLTVLLRPFHVSRNWRNSKFRKICLWYYK